jgi:hypothetical protein
MDTRAAGYNDIRMFIYHRPCSSVGVLLHDGICVSGAGDAKPIRKVEG